MSRRLKMANPLRTSKLKPKKAAPSIERTWTPNDDAALARLLATAEVLTPRVAAKFLNTTEGNLAVLRCEHRGPSFTRVGRRIMYFRDDLLAYVRRERREMEPTAA
jgi:hypothetical protein